MELVDLVEPAGEIGLVHRRLILEDLLLHRQERRLVVAEVAGDDAAEPR